MICTTQYLPPVDFFVKAYTTDKIVIEACENFIKQTYRNRCSIYSANGKADLTIFLEKCRRNHLPLKEVKISYTQPWNKMHWRAIVSAYNNSPFFMYYSYELEKFYDRQYNWLIDYNTQLLTLCLTWLNIEKPIEFTKDYLAEYPSGYDLRNRFTPRNASETQLAKYPQVFEPKFGFIPGLSIIDLIFNRGPEAGDYIWQQVCSNS